MEVKGIRKTKVGSWEATIQSTLLEKGRVARNFGTRQEAETYKARMLAILATGEVPMELQRNAGRLNQHTPTHQIAPGSTIPTAVARPGSPAISVVLRAYLSSDTAQIAKSDRPVVEGLQNQLKGSLAGINTLWVDAWVRAMKREQCLAPGTIRKKVEALARALDWWFRKEHPAGGAPSNPLRTLPRGYSTYQADDVKPGQERPTDQSRDRRLHPGEEDRIVAAVVGVQREDKERPWGKADDRLDFLMMYRLIVSTGMRLREAYRVRPGDIKFSLRTIHVPRSKTGAPRDIPMTRQLEAWLVEYLGDREDSDPLLPFWRGSDDEDVLRETSNRLSKRFDTLFEYAKCPDLREHDLRHEATCRWMEMKDGQGRWLFRPEEVRRITGHKSVQQFERYLSLRGSDLAERLD